MLRRLWELALRRRSSWASLADRSAWPGRSEAGGPAIVSAAVGVTHVIEDPASQLAARVEYAFLIPGLGTLLIGWLFDPGDRVVRMIATAGDGESGGLKDELVRLNRPDVREAYKSWAPVPRHQLLGFAGLARLNGGADQDIRESLVLRFEDARARTWELAPRPVTYEPDNPLGTIRTILSIVPPRDISILERHLGPAVSALWSVQRADDYVVEDVGTPPTDPSVSIIVPVYGRYDFIEYQMAAFARDPDLRGAELIYVIDDPSIVDDVRSLCRSIHPVFGIPHRLVLCHSNNGFAGATNIGAGVARAPVLLLLNSDVIPAHAGWLGAMLQAHAMLPDDGVLGARLLFPDGSLQHDGMRFAQEAWFPGVWLNQHPGKGLPPPKVSTERPQAVDAVTAACMMVSRERYEEAGGLDEGYIIGDFEDSDLCLKLRESGRGSYVAPWVQLYHLERQSQSLDGDQRWRQSLTLYNAWRHTTKWSHLLEDPHWRDANA